MAKPQTPNSSTVTNFTKSVQDGVVTGSSSQVVRQSWVDTFQGTKNPNWRYQVRKHMPATTAASGLKRTFEWGDGSFEVVQQTHRKSDGKLIHTAVLSAGGSLLLPSVLRTLTGDPLGTSVTAASRAAKLKILSRINSTYRRFQGGVFLGELRETIQMIRHPATVLRKGINSFHNSAKKRLSGRVKNVSVATRNRIVQDTWLEYVFGWKPLINDVNDAMQALGEKDYQEFLPVYGSGSGETAASFSDTASVNSAPVRRDWVVRTKASVRLRGECGATAASTEIGNWHRWGLGSWREALPTVWELIPYSFLVDYFTNIGSVIDGFATQTSSVKWINASTHVESEFELKSVQLNENALGALPWEGSDAIYRYSIVSSKCSYSGYVNRCTRFTRADWVPSQLAVSLADVGFRIPGVGSTKWLNIAALWHLRR